MRSWSRMRRSLRENAAYADSGSETRLLLLVVAAFWLICLASTLYLAGMASYYLFLAVLFGRYSPGTPASEYFAFVAQNAIPLLCFAAIGIVGLRCWPTDRLWLLGLLAGVVQTSLAIWMFVDPKLMLNLVP